MYEEARETAGKLGKRFRSLPCEQPSRFIVFDLMAL